MQYNSIGDKGAVKKGKNKNGEEKSLQKSNTTIERDSCKNSLPIGK
jgi:hypothetical protein